MRMKGFTAVLILFVALITICNRAEAADYQDRIDGFFKLIQQDKVSEAVDFIYSDNPWMNRATDAIQAVKDRMLSLDKMVGKYSSHEKLFEKGVADRLVHISYFVAYERQPLRFVFEFYRPKDKWIIYSFSFDDALDDELQAASTLDQNI